jgi:hypothetical protein
MIDKVARGLLGVGKGEKRVCKEHRLGDVQTGIEQREIGIETVEKVELLAVSALFGQ